VTILKDTFLFWELKHRVSGPCPSADAAARIRTALSASRFGAQDRLTGVLEGTRLRVWKASVFGQAADLIEFVGSLHDSDGGSVIDGTFRYRIQTKVQFAGLLIMGLGLAFAGVYRNFAAKSSDPTLLYIGGFICATTLLWIYASSKLRGIQTGFIAEQLSAAVAQ